MLVAREESRNRNPDAPPDEPWLARNDWASGRPPDTGGTSGLAAKLLGLVTVYWFIASGPLLVTLPAIFRQPGGFSKWVALAYPAIGVLLAVVFARQIARRWKFGPSVFEMANVPGVIGGQLAGVVRIGRYVDAADGFRLKLSCVEKRQNRNSDNETKVLWTDERMVTEPMSDAAADVTAVPVLFAIPFDLPESSLPKDERQVEWKLEVTAAVPGVNYQSSFELPVFKTPESRQDFSLDADLADDYGAAPSSDIVLRQAGIRKEPLPGGGVRLVFPAARQWGVALGLTAFATVWGGAIWVMLAKGAPIFFPIIFGLFEFLMVGSALDLWLYRSEIEASLSGIQFRGGWFGFGRERMYTPEEIATIQTAEQTSSSNSVSTNIVIVDTKGRRRRIAKGISSKLVERAVLDELNRALGRNSHATAVAADGADETRSLLDASS